MTMSFRYTNDRRGLSKTVFNRHLYHGKIIFLFKKNLTSNQLSAFKQFVANHKGYSSFVQKTLTQTNFGVSPHTYVIVGREEAFL